MSLRKLVDISTEEKQKELFELFNGFSTVKEILNYFGVSKSSTNLSYLHSVCDIIGFDLGVYAEKKRKPIISNCLYCGKPFTTNDDKRKRFCNSSCAASYNNRKRSLTDETKIKISESLKKVNYSQKEKEQILGIGENTHGGKTFRDKLFSSGKKEYKCECCGNKGEWNGKELVLQIHHIDGNHSNNDNSNLMVLCPNCHSQTDNYCSKNRKKTSKKDYCKNCGKEISRINVTGLCSNCYNSMMDSKKPQKEILEEKYKIFKTYAALSKIYGVSAKTIKKWLLSYDIKL